MVSEQGDAQPGRDETQPADGSPAVTAGRAAPEAADPEVATGPDGEAPADQESEHWWQAPGMPWSHKPTRADIVCMSMIMVIAVYALVMLPLRPVMLGFTPHLLAALGYRTGVVMLGALTATGDPWWPPLIIAATLMAMKFDWVYWWAGKLWGRGLLEMWSGRSKRARKRNERAERIALKYETLAIFLTYLPLPIPAGVVYAVLGMAGTSLKKFLIVDFSASLAATGIYFALGYALGAPAVAIVEQYSQYLWYISIGILVVMLVGYWWKESQKKRAGVEPESDE